MNDELSNLLQQWFALTFHSEARRFLQTYHQLLDEAIDVTFNQLLSMVDTDTTLSPTEQQNERNQIHSHYDLLVDIRKRCEALRGTLLPSHEQQLQDRAIRDGFVNLYSGFNLDLPGWLIDVISTEESLRQGAYQLEEECLNLWEQAFQRARQENLDLLILAEIQNRLGIYSGTCKSGNQSENIEHAIAYFTASLQSYDEESFPLQWANKQQNLSWAYEVRIKGDRDQNIEHALRYYTASLRTYTEEAFPYEWAMTQKKLGLTYESRIQGDQTENIERAIAYFTAALRVFTEQDFPLQWASIQNSLGNCYEERKLGERAANLEQSITYYMATLQVYTEEHLPYDWAGIQHNLGLIYMSRLWGERAENVELAITCFSAALRIRTEEAFPHEWAGTQHNLGSAYDERIWGNHAENLEQVIACFTASLRFFTKEAFPYQWASTQHWLGLTYRDRIEGNQAENIEHALACFISATEIYTEETYPSKWAMAQYNLGLLYGVYVKKDRAANIEHAIICFKNALRVYTEEAFPHQWADTLQKLGLAYEDRIKEDRAENLEHVIAYFSAALRIYTQEAFPHCWADIQNSLGLAYAERIREDHAESLEQAIVCFTNAMHIFTKDVSPFKWADIQNNLGIAHGARVRGERSENIEQAIAYYLAALEVRTEEACPLEWAITQNNLGLGYAYRMRGDWAENLEQAIVYLTNALRIFTEKTFPDRWAMAQNSLGNCYAKRYRGEPSENLEQAIAYCTTALRVFTKEAFPREWAMTQHNLGNHYGARMRGNPAENLEQSIDCYKAALHIRTQEAFPLQWADTQTNLGSCYASRIWGDRAHNLKYASDCIAAALQVFTEETQPQNHRITTLVAAEIAALTEQWEAANMLYRSALRTEDTLYALGARTKDKDSLLAEGRDGATRNAYVLVKLGRISEAAITLEHGRARWLAILQSIDAADPSRITNLQRRENYIATLQRWREAIAVAQQPEMPLPTSYEIEWKGYEAQRPENLPTSIMVPLSIREEMQRRQLARRRERDLQLRQFQDDFRAQVAEIQAAGDPSDFLTEQISEATLMAAAQRGPDGHAVISLVATPWGGMALGMITAHPKLGMQARFASLLLSNFTSAAEFSPVFHSRDEIESKMLGGFIYAQEGNILEFFRRDWGDPQRPSWDGVIPLQEWETSDAIRHEQALNETTFAQMAEDLRLMCDKRNLTSTLDQACRDVLAEQSLKLRTTTSWGTLEPQEVARIESALRQAFLKREIKQGLEAISDIVMRPLAKWLREEGVTSVTLIPCGFLTSFPILACPLDNGETFADAFQASIAPSVRSLLRAERSGYKRHGVATLGNPVPTHQSLKYGQAEALTLAHLGGEPMRCHIRTEATRDWLLHCLQEAIVVDASCHGSAEFDYLQSGLQLADGTLTLAEALNRSIIDLHGLRLLILSACQTAIPNLRGATNEVHSLAVGMLQAGVASVLASLWSVNDRATYLLIVRFAQEWFPNMGTEPPAAALARAQRWLRGVTWHELTQWQATHPLPAIIEAMPDYRSPDHFPSLGGQIGRMATVRGAEGYPLSDEDLLDEDDPLLEERYLMSEGQENIRDLATRRVKKDPSGQPYEHPFFWAGFQVTGW